MNFNCDTSKILVVVNKTTALLQKLQSTLSTSLLFTIYKSFVRPYLDHGNIVYDQAYNAYFQQKIENVFEELGLESLLHRRWCRKLSCFIKFWKPIFNFFLNIIPKSNRPYSKRNANNIPHFKVEQSFKNTFFRQSSLNGLNWTWSLNAPSLNTFKKNILKFKRSGANNILSW